MRVERIVLRTQELKHGQNSPVARVSVAPRAEDNGRLTNGATLTHCALSVPTASHAWMIRCSSGRETSRVLPGIYATLTKSTTNEAWLSMQVKLAREHVKSENSAVEACGAKWRHICAPKLPQISDRDDGVATSVSVSGYFLRANKAESGERIE